MSSSCGFTYLEMIIALVIIAAILVPLILQFPVALEVQRTSQVAAIANELARDLMEEIESKEFYDLTGGISSFGIEADEVTGPQTRTTFDDVDDYDDWQSGTAPQDISGGEMDGTGSLPDYQGYTRSVEVNKVAVDDPWYGPALPDGYTKRHLKRIKVTVANAEMGEKEVELVTLVARH